VRSFDSISQIVSEIRAHEGTRETNAFDENRTALIYCFACALRFADLSPLRSVCVWHLVSYDDPLKYEPSRRVRPAGLVRSAEAEELDFTHRRARTKLKLALTMDAHCAFAEYSSATVKGLLNRSFNHRSNLERAAPLHKDRKWMTDWVKKLLFLFPLRE